MHVTGSLYYVTLQRIQILTAPGYKVLVLKMHLFMLFPPELSCLNFRISFQNKADTCTEECINGFVCILFSLGQWLSYKPVLPTHQIEILYHTEQIFSVNSSPQSL